MTNMAKLVISYINLDPGGSHADMSYNKKCPPVGSYKQCFRLSQAPLKYGLISAIWLVYVTAATAHDPIHATPLYIATLAAVAGLFIHHVKESTKMPEIIKKAIVTTEDSKMPLLSITLTVGQMLIFALYIKRVSWYSMPGVVLFPLSVCLISSDRRSIKWDTTVVGMLVHLYLTQFMVSTEIGYVCFAKFSKHLLSLLDHANAGILFVLGPELDHHLFAFRILPTIIFFSSLISVLYHLNIINYIVHVSAVVLSKLLGTAPSETIATVGNIFVGQTQAVLLIRPYTANLTRSELHAIMASGFATATASILAAYISYGAPARAIICASILNAPISLVFAKIAVPAGCASTDSVHNQKSGRHSQKNEFHVAPPEFSNILDAVASGATNSIKLLANIAVILISFVAIVSASNQLTEYLTGLVHTPGVKLEEILTNLFKPCAVVMGIPWDDCEQVGELLGLKLVFNEIIAYSRLGDLIATGELSTRAILISTYALCGFANISSIGIQIGGIGAIIPERKKEIAEMAARALYIGFISSLYTASLVGFLLTDDHSPRTEVVKDARANTTRKNVLFKRWCTCESQDDNNPGILYCNASMVI